MTEFDPKALRTAFGSFMTGVTVVSTVDADGVPFGFTANSFSSVSLDPPLLLVCPAKSLSTFELFNRCTHFHVSVLAHDQQAVSDIFSSKQEDRFSHVAWHSDDNGCPVISNALANFSCQRQQSIDAGDHIILLGKITDFDAKEGQGLGYGLGGYFSLNMERKAAELQTHTQIEQESLIVGAIVEHQGRILLVDETPKFALPHIEIDNETPSFDAMEDYLKQLLGVAVNVGSVYSIFDHEHNNQSSIYYRVNIDDELQPQGHFYALDEIVDLSFSTDATRNIIDRYLDERSKGNHRLYVGSNKKGKVHRVEPS